MTKVWNNDFNVYNSILGRLLKGYGSVDKFLILGLPFTRHGKQREVSRLPNFALPSKEQIDMWVKKLNGPVVEGGAPLLNVKSVGKGISIGTQANFTEAAGGIKDIIFKNKKRVYEQKILRLQREKARLKRYKIKLK